MRFRERKFNTRDRGEVGYVQTDRRMSATYDIPPWNSDAPSNDTSKRSQLASTHPSSSFMRSASSGSPRHRFAHSAAKYYTPEPFPGPPPPPLPAAPSSPYRTRLNGKGERVPWRRKSGDLTSSLPS